LRRSRTWAASSAPVITGWQFSRIHSFCLPLAIFSLVTILGALSYLLVVKDPIRVSEAGSRGLIQ
jgi:hypothetical protein